MERVFYNGGGEGYRWALDYAETKEQKFLNMRALANFYYRGKIYLEHANLNLLSDNEYDAKEIKINEHNIRIYEDKIKVLLSQMPTCPEKHLEYVEDINQRFELCLAALTSPDDDTLRVGIDMFYKLHFDAYTLNSCPAMAILYHQAYIRVMLLTLHIQFGIVTELDIYTIFKFAREHMTMTQELLIKNFPEKIQEYNVYVKQFDDVMDQMLNVFTQKVRAERDAKEAMIFRPPVEQTQLTIEEELEGELEEEPGLNQDQNPNLGNGSKLVYG